MYFVAACGDKVHALPFLFYTYRNLAQGLHCVAVKPYLCAAGFVIFILKTGDFSYWHDGSRLVVHPHYGYEYGVFCESRLKLLHIQMTVSVHAYIFNLKSCFLKSPCRLQHGRMLYLRNDNLTSRAFSRRSYPCKNCVIRLGSSGGKIYFILKCTKSRCKGLPCLPHLLFRYNSKTVQR